MALNWFQIVFVCFVYDDIIRISCDWRDNNWDLYRDGGFCISYKIAIHALQPLCNRTHVSGFIIVLCPGRVSNQRMDSDELWQIPKLETLITRLYPVEYAYTHASIY